jgi:CMP-N-acetylneuraminic acid synthetase
MEKLIAILPMKGHSERVPNKNMKLFCGAPLYHAILKKLQHSKYISQISIDTDSEMIREDVLRNFQNVTIIDRPEELCGDYVSMNRIIEYDLSRLPGEHFLQTHSTNPLLTVETLNNAIETYFNSLKNYDSLFSVTLWQTRFYWQNGDPVNHNPEELIRTQDLPPVFEENSNFYVFSKSSFLKANSRRIGSKPKMFVTDRLESIDIDENTDFELAEFLYTRIK